MEYLNSIEKKNSLTKFLISTFYRFWESNGNYIDFKKSFLANFQIKESPESLYNIIFDNKQGGLHIAEYLSEFVQEMIRIQERKYIGKKRDNNYIII